MLDLEAQYLEKKAGKEAMFPQDGHKAGWRWGHPALWCGLFPEMLFKCWQLCVLALVGAAGFAFSRVKQATSNPGRSLLNIKVWGYQSDNLGSMEVILEGQLWCQLFRAPPHPGFSSHGGSSSSWSWGGQLSTYKAWGIPRSCLGPPASSCVASRSYTADFIGCLSWSLETLPGMLCL